MRTFAEILRAYWAEVPLYAYSALCGALCLMLWASHGVVYDHNETRLSFTTFYVSALIMFFIDIVWRLCRDRPARPLQWAQERYFSLPAARAVLCGLPAMAICVSMIPLFSSLKSMIPMFTAYDWDEFFIAADRALFFGLDGWQVLQPVFGFPVVTAALAALYHLWVLLLYPGCIFLAFYKSVSPQLRRRFFLSYALSWSVMGALMATLLASVGPVFAEPLVGLDTFREQMDYLRAAHAQIPVMTVPVQDMLLERFHADDRGLGSGITAMPSMHVAIAALFWLAMREHSERAGRLFFWFLVVIWIGSVHLAYHYAVDGLVSVIVVYAIWRLSEAIFALWDRVPTPSPDPDRPLAES